MDNGQNTWSLIAVAQVLREKGYDDLAARFEAHTDIQRRSAYDVFYNGKRIATSVNVKDKKKPAGAKLKQKGQLRDPFEGELMVMFMDLLADKINDWDRTRMWRKVGTGVQRKTYTGPPDGDLAEDAPGKPDDFEITAEVVGVFLLMRNGSIWCFHT